ncbi:homoserine kinase [Alteribacter natronophilus]|uniref:homoserine kinase n=1 Tax=Alteribacter natronophilus TaxID=2583810 RepID=UPI00110D6BBC|nr:homoserine kinase [Alteribacter natronophilus]TMW71852.1 homoserine kinase [Alteribacter natronophilus]
MSRDEMITITVPGSTANLGPGFDSVGMAVNRYLTLTASSGEQWSFQSSSPCLSDLPEGEDNLICKVASQVAEGADRKLPPCRVELASDIPMARGLGSSAAAIVAGIELADELLALNLPAKEKVRIASCYEGHPDNVAASVYGGLVIGTHSDKQTDVLSGIYPEVEIVAVVPDYELKTSSSRSLLPENLPFGEAVKASSVGNVLVAALMQNRWDVAGKMMQQDLFHQPYRSALVPELEKVITLTASMNVYGVALSGAGPIVMVYVPKGSGSFVRRKLASSFRNCDVQHLKPDRKGSQVKKSSIKAIM